MKHITTVTSGLVAAALAFSACGSSDAAEPLEAGRVELENPDENDDPAASTDEGSVPSDGQNDNASAGTGTAETTAIDLDNLQTSRSIPNGAPDFCTTLAVLDESSDRPQQTQFELLVQMIDEFAADGPTELRSDLAEIVDDYRDISDLGIDYLDVDQNQMTSDGLNKVIQLGIASEQFDAMTPRLIEQVSLDCGDGFMEFLTDNDAAASPSDDSNAQPAGGDDGRPELFVGEVFDEMVGGPFGTGTFNNTVFTITDLVWSNRSFTNFFETDPEIGESDVDERRAFITLELLNSDPNDRVLVNESHLMLLFGDEEFPAQQARDGDGIGRYLEPSSSTVLTFIFEVGEIVPADELTLRFADDRIPGLIDVIDDGNDDADEGPYPLAIDAPEPGEYIGNFDTDCDVIYTWSVDEASIILDLPAEYDDISNNTNGRASVGTRWLRLDGTILSGSADDESCVSTTGTVNGSNLRFLIDGRPVEPLNTPLGVLGEVESIDVDLFAEIPVDAVEVGIKALGRGDSTFESTVTLPDLPAVRGE